MNLVRSNQFSESWISQHPVLFFVYLNNYFPTLTKSVASKIGNKKVPQSLVLIQFCFSFKVCLATLDGRFMRHVT